MLRTIFFAVFAILFFVGLVFRMPTLILSAIGGFLATAMLPLDSPGVAR